MTVNLGRKGRAQQPLDVSHIEDALLNIRTIQALTGLGKTSIYERIKTGEFKPIRLGKRCTRFRARDVRIWLQAQGAEVAL
jgi:prophage regulatory protein